MLIKRGWQGTTSLMLAVVMLVALLAMPVMAADKKLPIPRYQQGENQWCWVAATQILVKYHLGKIEPQCQLHKWGKAASTCPNTPGNFGSEVTRALSKAGIRNTGTVVADTVRFSRIVTEIDASRPLLMRAGWKSTDKKTAHMIPIRGYNNDSGNSSVHYLHIYTKPKDSEFRTRAYSFMINNSDWGWTHTRYSIS
jgi:hypothetical protein